MTIFPARIDDSITLPKAKNNVTLIDAPIFNSLRDAVLAIESTLGVNPAGIYSTLRNRIDNLEIGIADPSVVEFFGDVNGRIATSLVVGLYGNPIKNINPSINNVLSWDGSFWSPGQLTLDPEIIAPAFSISLFGGTLIEVGNTLSTPSFTSTKNYNATSAILSNNYNSEQKNVLTEFNLDTSFSSNFSYTKNSYGDTVIFTLTANKNSIIRTSATTFTWTQKVYWGIGPAGESSETFIKSLTGFVLTTTKNRSFSTGSGGVGSAGATDKIYYAYRTAYGSSNFSVGGFSGGFTLVSTTISVTNAFGFTENYTLYESDNLGLGSITVNVT